MGRLATIAVLVAALGAAALPALAGDGCSGPEPRLSPAMHRVLFLAHGHLEKGRYAQAAQVLARFTRANPGARHYRLSFTLGLVAYYQKDLAGARRHLQAAIQQRGCFVPALQNLAVVLLEQKKPLAAAAVFKSAYGYSRSKRPQLLYQAAVSYLIGRRPALAAPLFEELAGLPRPRPQWLKGQVRCYLEMKLYAKARAIVARLLAAAPAQADLWRLAAELNLRDKKYGPAAAALEVAYRLAPPGPDGWRQLASLYQAAGVPLKAAEYLRRAAGRRPSARDLETLAKIYLGGHYLERALAAARQAAQARPTARRWALVGRIHLLRCDYGRALPAFTKAAKADDPQGRYSLVAGYCAWQLDRLLEAKRAFARALRHAGSNQARVREATRALEAVKRHLEYRRSQAAPEMHSSL